MRILLTLIGVLFLPHPALSQAPASVTVGGVTISRAEIDTLGKELKAKGGFIDRLIKSVEVVGGTAGVALVHRDKPETGSITHRDATETYYMVEGAGTVMTGGQMAPGAKTTDLARLAVGITMMGPAQGGTGQRIGPGEVLIIPAGVPHTWSQLDGPILYLVYRFSPTVAK